jgi:hypothetical protein
MGDVVISEEAAVEAAKAFLRSQLNHEMPASHIYARYLTEQDLQKGQRELKDFLLQNGVVGDHYYQLQLAEMGLLAVHWNVLFYAIDAPGTASTIPPTIVRVYNNGNVEFG